MSHAEPEPSSVFQQIIDIYVGPEIERRRAAGRLPRNFTLHAAQLICSADAAPNQIRLNDEVQAIALVRWNKAVRKELGDPVFRHEVEGIETIVLPETEDPNCGHATLLRFGAQWYVAFDFRYNRGRSRELLAKAEQFRSAATRAHAAAEWSAFAYNLFTAMELAAKAELLVAPDQTLLRVKSHKTVHSRINKWAHLGNVDLEHVTAFNELARLRQDAAYSMERFVMSADRAADLLEAVVAFLERVRARADSRRLPRGHENYRSGQR